MGDVLAVIAAAGVAGGARWWWLLYRHPYGKCRWCRGTGRNPGSTGERYGLCTHCKGGQRVRFGAGLVHPELRKGVRRK